MGEEMFVMQWIVKQEFPFGHDLDVLQAYNKIKV
jgi:hypothetical protein